MSNKMKVSNRIACAIALTTAVFAAQAPAASWQEQLSSAASELTKSSSAGAESGGLSLASLTSLLNGGSSALSSSSMSNATGIISYCAKNKLASVTNADNIKSQLMSKLGLAEQAQPETQPDYTQGLMGLLNTGNGQQLDLKTLGSSPLAEKVKTKACDLVLKQGMKYLS